MEERVQTQICPCKYLKFGAMCLNLHSKCLYCHATHMKYCAAYPPPLAQARPRSPKSGQNGGSTPNPCLDKAVHARNMHDSKRVGEPSDGDGEGLRMGKSTLSKAALCSNLLPIPHVLQMDVVVHMTIGIKKLADTCSPVLRTYMTAMPG
jgi:hypothetical protein